MSENIENESHLRGVIEQLQTRNRALEREARNGRAIIGSLKAAMREDSEHFFTQAQEIATLKAERPQSQAECYTLETALLKIKDQGRARDRWGNACLTCGTMNEIAGDALAALERLRQDQ